jgi:adenylyltransferase/sulfurtransferase
VTLSDQQLERYARHIVLKEIGGTGQAKLLAAKVAVIGAGGLGSPCLLYLAAAGVGQLTIIDDDDVDLTNLQRQVLHGTPDIGRSKVESAADAIRRLNPEIVVHRARERLEEANATELLSGHDVIADGSDSFETRHAVADAAFRLRIPLVSAAIGPFEGQMATFRGWETDRPCWRCFAGSAADRAGATCSDTGVLGALAGVMGAMQAIEVIREISPFGDSLAGRLLLYDALGPRMRIVSLPKDPKCPACRNE